MIFRFSDADDNRSAPVFALQTLAQVGLRPQMQLRDHVVLLVFFPLWLCQINQET